MSLALHEFMRFIEHQHLPFVYQKQMNVSMKYHTHILQTKLHVQEGEKLKQGHTREHTCTYNSKDVIFRTTSTLFSVR